MIELHIGCHAQTHRIAFADREAAQAELDRLIPLLGRDKWGSNGKSEAPTHTIKCPAGDVALVLDKIETARLIDTTANENLYRPDANALDDENIERVIRHRKRLQEAGVLWKTDVTNSENPA